jgi:indolepyruvate decarboxylase
VMSNNVYAIEQAFVNLDAFKPDGEFAGFDVLPAWDYVSLARGFGATGRRADTVGSLRGILAEVVNAKDGPVLVEVVIPEKDLAPQLERLAATPVTLRRANRRTG